jgi:hypothetical protein
MNMEQQAEHQAQIAPTTRIEVVLEAQQWNAVMAAISKQPYEFAAPLINAIQQQCMAKVGVT